MAFDIFKEKLTCPPIVSFPHLEEPFLLYTDASKHAVGGVLAQKLRGREHVISYTSHTLNGAHTDQPQQGTNPASGGLSKSPSADPLTESDKPLRTLGDPRVDAESLVPMTNLSTSKPVPGEMVFT